MYLAHRTFLCAVVKLRRSSLITDNSGLLERGGDVPINGGNGYRAVFAW